MHCSHSDTLIPDSNLRPAFAATISESKRVGTEPVSNSHSVFFLCPKWNQNQESFKVKYWVCVNQVLLLWWQPAYCGCTCVCHVNQELQAIYRKDSRILFILTQYFLLDADQNYNIILKYLFDPGLTHQVPVSTHTKSGTGWVSTLNFRHKH